MQIPCLDRGQGKQKNKNNLQAPGIRGKSCLSFSPKTAIPISEPAEASEAPPSVRPGLPTCNVRVLEHQQEPITERGADCLRASKEERQNRHDEVWMIKLCLGVRLILNTERWGSHQGRPGALLPIPLLSGSLLLFLGLKPSGPFPFPLCDVCPTVSLSRSQSPFPLSYSVSIIFHLFGVFVPLPLPVSLPL